MATIGRRPMRSLNQPQNMLEGSWARKKALAMEPAHEPTCPGGTPMSWSIVGMNGKISAPDMAASIRNRPLVSTSVHGKSADVRRQPGTHDRIDYCVQELYAMHSDAAAAHKYT